MRSRCRASTPSRPSIERRHAENIVGLRKDVMDLRDNFAELVREQEILGFDESDGPARQSARSRQRGRAHHQREHDLAGRGRRQQIDDGAADHAAPRSRIPAQSKRADAGSNSSPATRNSPTPSPMIDGTPEMKDSLEQQVKTYADTFAQWIDGFDRVHPLRAVIDIDSQRMLPRADEIIERARADRGSGVDRRSTASQARTRTGIIAVGIAMVALGLGFSWLIGRSITRPLNGLAGVMKRLAAGDTSRAHSRHPRARRNRRDGAHRDRVPRQHDRARTAGRRRRPKPAARRSSAATRSRAPSRNSSIRSNSALGKLRGGVACKLEMSSTDLNKRRRHRVGGGAHRRTARRRRIRQRHRGRQLGRGTGGLDRRNRLAGREIHRRRGPRGLGSPAHRHHHDGTRQRRHPHRRGGRPDPGDRRADQPARAQRHHRGGPRRRSRQRLRGGRLGSEIARRPDRARRPRRSPSRSARSSRPPPTPRRRSSRSTPSSATCRRSPPRWRPPSSSRTRRWPRSPKASAAPRARRAAAPRR